MANASTQGYLPPLNCAVKVYAIRAKVRRQMEMKIDALCGSEIAEFLEEHIREMKSVSPPESKHALDLEGLRKPEITFWTVWDEGRLIGCGAIKELGADHAEIKSMRTAASYRGKGVASMLLQHILKEAKLRGYRRISLETGSMPFFDPARNLYAKYGFRNCAPFSTYKEDPNSVFMAREL
jgi:putative acetyltransferase